MLPWGTGKTIKLIMVQCKHYNIIICPEPTTFQQPTDQNYMNVV